MDVHNAAEAIGKEKEKMPTTGTANSLVEDMKVESTPQNSRMLLLEDSTLEQLPEHCNNLLSQIYDEFQLTQADLLAILIYCIALESGFVLTEIFYKSQIEPVYWGSPFHRKNVIVLSKFPHEFKFSNKNFYEFNLTLYTYTSNMQCHMIGIQTGGSFIVTLTPNTGTPGYSICLSISRFVLSMKARNTAARFRNLKELSLQLKEHIFGPARNCMVEMSGEGLFAGLCGVPSEIIYLIIRKFDMKYVQNLSKTCWKMRALCEAYYKYKSQSSSSSVTYSLLSSLSDM